MKHHIRTILNIKKGVVSKEQQDWIDELNKQGYLAVVCYGFDSAVCVIAEYLK